MNPIPQNNSTLLLNTVLERYLVLAPDLTIIAASKSYLNDTGIDRESIFGNNFLEVFPDHHPDTEVANFNELKDSLTAVLRSHQPHVIPFQQYRVRHPDGEFEIRYRSLINTPVFDEHNHLLSIVHQVIDSTATYRANTLRERSEKDYELLIDSIKDYAIFMIDPAGNIASWNRGAAYIKGYTAEEIVGKPIDTLYTHEDRAQGLPKSNLQEALRCGHYEGEGLRLKKDGTVFWADIVITALKNERGIFYGYAKITRDVTERKKAEAQHELLLLQINQSNSAILTTDAHRRINSWNIGAQNLYGYAENEVRGKDVNEVLRTTIFAKKRPSAVEKISIQDYWTGELQRKTKTGKVIYVRSSATAIRDSKGTITGYVSVSLDITEEKRLRAEVNHLANVVEQSSEAIISRGIDERILSWNKGAQQLFGYTKKEAVGKTATELGITRFTEQETLAIEQSLLKKGSWTSEGKFLHRNGSNFFGDITANAVISDQGEITSFVFIIKDISLRRQLEVTLKKSMEELEEKVRIRAEETIKKEKRFRALIENSSDIITLLDKSFKVFYRSPSATRITGWTDNEMLYENGIKNVHPADKEKAKDIVRELKASPGKAINCQLRNLHKDGHYLWLEGVVINLLQDDSINAVVFNLRDVTERVEAEEELHRSFHEKENLTERLSAILNSLPANIALLDEKGIILDVNDAWKKFGDDNCLETHNYSIGKNYVAISKNAKSEESDDGQAVAKGIVSVLEHKAKEFVYEYPCHAPKQRRWFRMVVTPLNKKDCFGAVVMHIDISELRRLEEERLKSKTEEQQTITRAILSAQEKERHAIGLELHDNVNQILTGTSLLLSFARDGDGDIKELLGTAIKYLRDALDENRKIAHVFVSPDENESLLEQLTRLVKTMLEISGITVSFTIKYFKEELLDAECKINIYRIVQEQCTNIVKYAEATDVKIILRTSAQQFNMTISDDGKGVVQNKTINGIGLKNIAARLHSLNGKSAITSSPRRGFILEVSIPLPCSSNS